VKSELMVTKGSMVMQMLQGDKDPQFVGRMNLTQFKAFCSAAKLTFGKFNGDRLDDIFTAVAASPAALKRKLDSSATSTMTFADFLILLAHLAYHRFASMVRLDLAPTTQALLTVASTSLVSMIIQAVSDICFRMPNQSQRGSSDHKEYNRFHWLIVHFQGQGL
jgi:hypothetical protein